MRDVLGPALFACQWEGRIRVRIGVSTQWRLGGFAVVQGHRVLWWHSEEALEVGQPADAQLLLQGHAGLTAPSPKDVKDVGGKDTRLVAVFGRSTT